MLLVATPGGITAVVAIVSASRALEKAVGRDLAAVANDAAHELRSSLDEQQEAFDVWARQGVMRELIIGDVDKRVSRFLLSVKRSSPGYVALLATDGRGHTIAATDPAAIGGDERGRPAYTAAVQGRSVTIGPTTTADDRTLVEFAAAVYDPEVPGRIIGVLIGTYDWDVLTARLIRTRATVATLGLVVDILIVDDASTVIGGDWSETLTMHVGRDLRAAGWHSARPETLPQRLGYVSDRGARLLVGHADVPDTEWTVLVTQPWSEALAPVVKMRNGLILILGSILMVGLAVAVLLAQRMSRPLQSLTRAAREIAQTGRTSVPLTSATSRDEIGELQHAFRIMARDLKRTQDELVNAARLALVGEVAAGMAHEIRTPLGILRGSAQMLGRTLPADAAQPAELVTMIVDEVDRLDAIVGSLTELARPQPPAKQAVGLEGLLQRAVDFIAATADEKGVVLRCVFPPGERVALCDPDQIYQVALNLIVNAVQILPRGGTVSVETLTPDPGTVGFAVRDDGPGISPEQLRRIFAPFFSARDGGTGLGLAVVKRIVEAHDGSVSTDSSVGHGTTFTVLLPVFEESS